MVAKKDMDVEYKERGVDLEWDAFVDKTGGDIHQTSLWSEYEYNSKNWRGYRFIVKNENNIVAGCQISIITIRFLGQIGYVQMGPCVNEKSSDTINIVIDELKKFSRKNRLLYLIIAPNFKDADIVPHLELKKFIVKKQSLPPAPRLDATLLLDLALSEDALLAQMKSMRKRNIRKGLTMPVQFKEGSRKDLKTFYDLSVITANRHKAAPGISTLEGLYMIWDLMSPYGCIYLHEGVVEGETVCGALSFAFGNTFQYTYWGWNCKYNDYYISDVFQWNLIRYAKEKGYKYYDFVQLDLECVKAISSKSDVPDSIKQKNFYGPTLFKMQFGGSIVTYPSIYAYFPNRMKFFLIHKIAGSILARINLKSVINFIYGLSRR
ncbi:MAG: peptidoglycan bridge formation glycyltransferase FemA/FemB family protein [Cytophagaceae bacterium]|jgi:lipid II:glycine glycyltransferase (peptidoglycan interpeptide bridge formation enzyme)|nr:peptidoglycan bridge formation glycyltransferase FemA/FemB family protein [Cytophagaceae bacterium]